MYLECTHSLACPSSLWRYWLPGLSSASGGLSPWLNGSTLGGYSTFECCLLGLLLIIKIIYHYPVTIGSAHIMSWKNWQYKAKKKKKFSLLCLFNCSLGYRQTLAPQGLHIVLASHQSWVYHPGYVSSIPPHKAPPFSLLAWYPYWGTTYTQCYHSSFSPHGRTTSEHLHQSSFFSSIHLPYPSVLLYPSS